MSLALSPLRPPVIWAGWEASPEAPGRPVRMTPPEDTSFQDERSRANADLLRRMANGDRDALAELYDSMAKPLFATARHILNDPAEAQDVVHDVFLSLWENAASFDSRRGAAFSWAVTLTRNRSIDRLRSRANRARLLGETFPGDLGYGEAEGPGPDASDLGARAELVRTAVAGLPDEQKRALELAFFSGLTQREIADRLSEPLGTVKARIRRGLIKLRDTLAGRL